VPLCSNNSVPTTLSVPTVLHRLLGFTRANSTLETMEICLYHILEQPDGIYTSNG